MLPHRSASRMSTESEPPVFRHQQSTDPSRLQEREKPIIPGSAYFHILITGGGTAVINGEKLPSTRGPVQTAVLDVLHSHAQASGHLVEAKILDQQQKSAFHLKVRPDGSSEFVEDVHDSAPAVGQNRAQSLIKQDSTIVRHLDDPSAQAGLALPPIEVAGRSTEPIRPTGVAREPGVHRTNGVVVDARRPSSASAVRAARLPDMSASTTPTTAPVPVPVPSELTDAVDRVTHAVAAGNTDLASTAANAVVQHSARVFGAEHPCTLEAFALEAYVAHIYGDQEHSAALSLRLASLRHQQGDPRAREEILRAAIAWSMVNTPRTAIALGGELLSMWTQLVEAGCTAIDEQGLRHVERRLAVLGQPPGPGAKVRPKV